MKIENMTQETEGRIKRKFEDGKGQLWHNQLNGVAGRCYLGRVTEAKVKWLHPFHFLPVNLTVLVIIREREREDEEQQEEERLDEKGWRKRKRITTGTTRKGKT